MERAAPARRLSVRAASSVASAAKWIRARTPFDAGVVLRLWGQLTEHLRGGDDVARQRQITRQVAACIEIGRIRGGDVAEFVDRAREVAGRGEFARRLVFALRRAWQVRLEEGAYPRQGQGADEFIDHPAAAKQLYRGNAANLKLLREILVLVGVHLDDLDLARRVRRRPVPAPGPSARQGPHQGAQKSTSTGCDAEASMTSDGKVAVVTALTDELMGHAIGTQGFQFNRISTMTHFPPLERSDAIARAINPRYLTEEQALVRELADHARLAGAAARSVAARSLALVQAVRSARGSGGALDAFLREYSLASREGVILMCLAEALLRIPDGETADRLIADKIPSGAWDEHLGDSDSLLVNASTWGLMLTGRVVALDRNEVGEARSWYGKLAARLGEPVARAALKQAMRILGHQFVMGRDIDAALSARRRQGRARLSLFLRHAG